MATQPSVGRFFDTVLSQLGTKEVANIMRKRRLPITLVLAGMIASLITFVSTASAAESIPELKWPAAQGGSYGQSEVSPQGETTLSCDPWSSGQDLVTYGVSGNETRRLSRTQQIDGVSNCIYNIAVDKRGDLYGSPKQGTNLLAYKGNTLKWKYPLGCTYYMANPVVGADGNIYAVNGAGRLIGLTPEVQPPTTQPKKILDAPTSNARCDTTLLALKDGLVTVADMRATFYSYSGVHLGTTPSDALVREENDSINASGRVFYDKYVESGGMRGATISAYDYGRKETTWTRTVSVDGAYVYSAAPHATQDGGVLVYLREREQDQLGTITGRTVYSLVKVSAFGNVLWRKTLSLGNPGQSTFAASEIKTDTYGNIIVVRNGQLKTNDPNNAEVEGISIVVLNSAGTVIYDKVMRGNLDKNAGEVTGYQLKANTLQAAPGVLHFTAQPCTNGCFTTTKLYPVKVPALGLDYPRGAIYNKNKRPGASYLALGDSFSSGEGVEPFEAGTAIPLMNKCHRSSYAYPKLIAGTSPKIPSLGSNGFRACSGATTEHITDAPQWNESVQLDLPVWPDTTTQLVTLTIGGNDIKFGEFGSTCVFGNCEMGSTAYNASVNEISNTLPTKLKATYEKILKFAPNAKLYVLGYPQVITNKSATDPDDIRCVYMQGGSTKWGEARAARDIVTKLNKAILDNVNTVRSLNADYFQRLKYVPLDGEGSPFIGHEICGTGASWFLNVNQGAINDRYPFHPNQAGQVNGYAAVAAAAINAG